MPRQPVSASITISWLSHDSWSAAYVGTRKLAYEVLSSGADSSAEDDALCQLAILGSNHLMEVALYALLRPHAQATGKAASLTEALLEDASYHQMLTKWVSAIAGKSLDLSTEPFLSTERLRRRRNDTTHKSSALATLQMARSSLFSAVEGTRALYAHMTTPFPYDPFLTKYPLPNEAWFSGVPFPPGT